ncbi:MAG: Wadjet anti-phage system protein JetD domain-containing protein, partial [Myxococcota bacterium]
MWTDEAQRLALLELWASGHLKRRKAQGDAWDELARLPWTRRTSRRDELVLDEAYRWKLESLLDHVFPAWRAVAAVLGRRKLALDLRGYRALAEQRRAEALPAVQHQRLNRRTATAAVAAHSKATLGERLLAALGPVEVTRDGLIRARPNPGLTVVRDRVEWSGQALAQCLGELTLSERALRDGTRLGGTLPRALLTVENVGFYIDVAVPRGWMVVHLPGWNTATIKQLLAQLPEVPVVHFGDLDPNGVRIVAHLQILCPDLIWAVPPFWAEHIPLRGQTRAWPADLDLDGVPVLVQRL